MKKNVDIARLHNTTVHISIKRDPHTHIYSYVVPSFHRAHVDTHPNSITWQKPQANPGLFTSQFTGIMWRFLSKKQNVLRDLFNQTNTKEPTITKERKCSWPDPPFLNILCRIQIIPHSGRLTYCTSVHVYPTQA